MKEISQGPHIIFIKMAFKLLRKTKKRFNYSERKPSINRLPSML